MAFWTKWWKRNSPERPSTSLANPDSWLFEVWGNGKSDAGIAISPDKALEIATVWQCVTMLTDDFAKIPTNVYRDNPATGGREKDKAHAAHWLLRRKANRYLTANHFKRTMLFHALMYGNGYAWITKNGRFEPSELLILDPTKTEPQRTDNALFYVTYINGDKVVLAAEEVFHLRGVGFDGVKGYSVISYALNSLGLTIAAEKYGSKHFANGTRVSGVLQLPGRISPQAAQQLEKSFQARHEGLDNAHKTILLEEGAKFTPTQQTPNEAQFIELRQFQRKEIAAWFKIPPSKLGDPDSVSYNSLEQWNQAYLESALDPWFCSFEDEAFEKLLTERQKYGETHYIEFNRNALLRTDLESRYRAYAQGRQWGWESINDIRRKENLEAIGPEGDVYLTPVNMTNAARMTVEALDAQDQAKADQAKAALDAKAKASEAKPTPKKVAEEKSRPLVESVVSRAARRLIDSGRKAIAKQEWRDAVAERLNDHWNVLASTLKPALDALSLSGADAYSDAMAAVQRFDHRLELEMETIATDADTRDERLAKWDVYASRLLTELVPQTVDDIVRAYSEAIES